MENRFFFLEKNQKRVGKYQFWLKITKIYFSRQSCAKYMGISPILKENLKPQVNVKQVFIA